MLLCCYVSCATLQTQCHLAVIQPAGQNSPPTSCDTIGRQT
uniref:Uncharacterized protein n=1 Tax=Anguilla anguilla TaxID=7936 RepID=A0A0E9Q6J8_ANGAN